MAFLLMTLELSESSSSLRNEHRDSEPVFIDATRAPALLQRGLSDERLVRCLPQPRRLVRRRPPSDRPQADEWPA